MIRMSYINLLLWSLLFFVLSSCVNPKEFIYFQKSAKDSMDNYSNLTEYKMQLKPDDLVSIQLSAVDPEVLKPFNFNNQQSENPNNLSGYLIDANGNIDFPVIGTIALAGKTRTEAAEYIKGRLKQYINNPVVNVRVLNRKITILGDVKNPGVYQILNDRITMLEALGMAGDLNVTGVRKNVLVVREIDGKRTEYRVDLTTKEVYTSPVYYLVQNDVIYVEPGKGKINSTQPTAQYGMLAITATTLLINIINLISRLQ